MNLPDLIITQPVHIDFPLFRYNLKRFRHYFDEVYIGLSYHGQLEDYSEFFIRQLDSIAKLKRIPRITGSEDWRNKVVTALLEKSTADRVLFLEQDFLVRDVRFFEVLLNVSDYDFLYYEEGQRIHPACALVPKHIIDKTSKDFSARPPAYDHFGLFFQEAMRLSNSADLETVGLRDRIDFLHLQGTTQNYHAQPYHRPNQFLTYCFYSLRFPIIQGEFRNKMERIVRDSLFEESEADEVVRSMFPKEVTG